MDIETARTFLVVISSGSFVEAAKRLYVTQSTVSARIQRLEAELGAELFVRHKSGTTLTPAPAGRRRPAGEVRRYRPLRRPLRVSATLFEGIPGNGGLVTIL